MQRALDRMAARARGLLLRGRVVKAALNPKRTLLQVTRLAGETLSNIELFLPYGQSAFPTGKEDVILLPVGGSHGHLVALFADASGLRITDLQPGEFGWKDVNAQTVVFRKDKIEIVSPQKDIYLTTPAGNINLNGVTIDKDGNLHSPGNVSDQVRTMAADRAKFDAHKHSDPQGGVTGTTDTPE